MAANTRLILVSLFASAVAISSTAWAGSPVELTNAQLDHITAGGAIVAGSVDAQATGVLALTSTMTNSLAVSGGSSYKGQPGYTTDAAAVAGTAVAVGNGGSSPSSNTSVITGGAAQGNQVLTYSTNITTHGVGGVTVTNGWTFVYGAWVGL